jgi:hypothetical protein
MESTGTVILSLIGIGIIVVLGMLLIEMRSPRRAESEVIVERRVPAWGYGPHYSHLPLRPLVY